MEFTFHAYPGARRAGKTNVTREQAAAFLPIAGVVADPIDITTHDVETADPADLQALAAAAWLPGVTTQTVLDPIGRRIVRVSSTPCIATMGA